MVKLTFLEAFGFLVKLTFLVKLGFLIIFRYIR